MLVSFEAASCTTIAPYVDPTDPNWGSMCGPCAPSRGSAASVPCVVDNTEARLRDTEAKLHATEARLCDTEAKLVDTEARLVDTETRLLIAFPRLKALEIKCGIEYKGPYQ